MRNLFKYTVSFLITVSFLMPVFGIFAFAENDYNVSTMHPGVNNNTFDNTAEYFVGENEKSKYYIYPSQMRRLTEGENEDTKNLIMSQALSPFGGACYGISVTMALSFVGKIDMPEQNYSLIKINEQKSFRNRINFYHLTQYCQNKEPKKTAVISNGVYTEDPLKQIVEYAKSGTPFVISIRTAEFAHSLVACGIETDEDGTNRVRMLDCNNKKEFMYLVVSPTFDSWNFDNSPYIEEDIIDMSFSTLDAYSPFDMKVKTDVVYSAVSSSDDIDTLCASKSSNFVLTNIKGQTLTFENGEISGDIEYNIVKYIANDDGSLNSKIVFTIEDSNGYTVENMNAEEDIDLTLVGDNGLFFSVQGKNIKKIFAEEGKTSIEGENMEYSVSTLSTENKVDMINISGADPDRITFETKDGVTVSETENGKLYVSLISKGKISEAELSTLQGSKSIIYSDIVKMSKEKNKTKSTLKVIILVFIGVVFSATVFYAVKKRKKK